VKLERLYTRKVLATTRNTSLVEASVTMHRFGVGALLVMDDAEHDGPPVGIVTDRDIVVRGCASENAHVGDVMTPVVATVPEHADTHEAIELMRAHAVRRLVVTDKRGDVCGIVSIDDIVDGLATDLAAASAVLKGEVRRDSAGLGEVRIGG
jgi:predicted transcriptional regulator